MIIVRGNHRRGMVLLMTILLLIVVVFLLSVTVRMLVIRDITSHAFYRNTESQAIAEGIAQSLWQKSNRLTSEEYPQLLGEDHWTTQAWDITITLTSSQHKLHLHKVESDDWVGLWQERFPEIQLAASIYYQPFVQKTQVLESFLDNSEHAASKLFLSTGEQPAPWEWVTLVGSGHIDLNHCSREILSRRLKGFTDAQISGILRIREETLIQNLQELIDPLNLTADQVHVLNQSACLAPETLEATLHLKQGAFEVLYYAVIRLGPNGGLQELRLII